MDTAPNQASTTSTTSTTSNAIKTIKRVHKLIGQEGIPCTLAQAIKRSHNTRVTDKQVKDTTKTQAPPPNDWREQLLQIEQRKVTETEAFLNIVLYKLSGDIQKPDTQHEEKVLNELQKLLEIANQAPDTHHGL